MIDAQKSKQLNVLKLLFCFSIIFLHMHSQMPAMESMPDTGSFFFHCLRITRDLVSNLLTKVAVPGFAFISGYLFFATADFSFSIYKNKLHKRIFSLLIPYITWILVVFVGDVILAYFGKNNLVSTTEWDLINSLNIFWGIKSNDAGFCPYNGPMWYIRDLFLGALITPIIWYFLKTKILRFGFLLLVFLLWIYPVILPPHETIFLFYFSLGCFFPIAKVDFFEFCDSISKKHLYLILISSITITNFVNEFYAINIPRSILVKSFVFFSFPFLFCFAKHFVNENTLRLSKCTFVVYCMHNIVLAMFGKITYGMSSEVNLLYYFTLPILTFIFGYCLYMILTKINNSILNLFFLGKR